MAQKSREEGEIGSESREKGDLPPCSPPPPVFKQEELISPKNIYERRRLDGKIRAK